MDGLERGVVVGVGIENGAASSRAWRMRSPLAGTSVPSIHTPSHNSPFGSWRRCRSVQTTGIERLCLDISADGIDWVVAQTWRSRVRRHELSSHVRNHVGG